MILKLKTFAAAALLALMLIPAYSFTLTASEQAGVIFRHYKDDGTLVTIAVPMAEKDKIACHRTHGDAEVPYSDDLYKRIIGTQEGGANFCDL
jgi:hypothetical protein